VKLLPDTATALWEAKSREGSVIHGVKELALMPVKLHVKL
jgi:hypothetical protein